MMNHNPAKRGVNVVVSINDNKIGGQKNAVLNRRMSSINITNKINGEWNKSLAGTKAWDLNCAGFIVKDEQNFRALEECFNTGTAVNVKLSDGNISYTGSALITSFPISAPYNQSFSYSITLLGISELEFSKKEE